MGGSSSTPIFFYCCRYVQEYTFQQPFMVSTLHDHAWFVKSTPPGCLQVFFLEKLNTDPMMRAFRPHRIPRGEKDTKVAI